MDYIHIYNIHILERENESELLHFFNKYYDLQ